MGNKYTCYDVQPVYCILIQNFKERVWPLLFVFQQVCVLEYDVHL